MIGDTARAAAASLRGPEADARRLVLFTSEFPYGPRETFLETEIEYLAEAFEQVCIVPEETPPGLRDVPANVIVDDSLARIHAGRNRAVSAARAIATPEFLEEIRRRPSTLREPRSLRRVIGHAAALARIKRWVLQNFANGPENSRTVFYSYWLLPPAAALAAAAPALGAAALVARAHRYDLYDWLYDPAYIPFQRKMLEGLDRVFSVSRDGLDHLSDRFPDLAHQVEVARLGVRDPGFVARASDDGTLRLLTCSNLLPVKRLELLTRGLSALAERQPELRIQWDHLGDGRLRPEIERAAGALPERVRWKIHGMVSNDGVFEWYRTRPVDVFVNVSASEGVPVSIMEAMSCGVPIVATAVGGTPEIVNEDVGVLLPPDPTAEEVAQALDSSRPDRPRARAWRNASRAGWAERSDARRNYTRFAESLRTAGQLRARSGS